MSYQITVKIAKPFTVIRTCVHITDEGERIPYETRDNVKGRVIECGIPSFDERFKFFIHPTCGDEEHYSISEYSTGLNIIAEADTEDEALSMLWERLTKNFDKFEEVVSRYPNLSDPLWRTILDLKLFVTIKQCIALKKELAKSGYELKPIV